MKILYRLLVVILCFIVPIYFICFSLPFIVCGTIVNIFRYILVGKTYCLHVIFERHIDKLFKLVDYCNNK
jgi:hypothetical protein